MKDMKEMRVGRRPFIQRACALATAALVGPAVIGSAFDATAQESHETGRGGTEGYIIDASVKERCGTCEFWGGPRRVSEDSKTLTITGLGWCNNSKCPNDGKLTSPDHTCAAGTWRKWGILA